MLNVKTKGLLQNIIKCCTRIERIIKDKNKQSFNYSDDIKEIVCFNFMLIYELIECLDEDIVNQYIGISWSKMKEIGYNIVHDYENIDDKVWLTATLDVKPLRECCEKVLKVH